MSYDIENDTIIWLLSHSVISKWYALKYSKNPRKALAEAKPWGRCRHMPPTLFVTNGGPSTTIRSGLADVLLVFNSQILRIYVRS